ncbi:uncharacterized protein LODBEIA_P37300 [Lodderomyces beijingensis]|uniref:TRUD domain-containing protein n=1 Tax=Lodderomyces beijingensis TaxID=1775926 RepID=A0ABP0ZMY9_9ASCO
MLKRLLQRRIPGLKLMSQALKRSASREDVQTASATAAKKFKQNIPPSAVSEADVGITQFINTVSTGFRGSLKTMHSDFQVNEIDPSGTVVHLVDEGIEMGKSNRERREERKQRERVEFAGKTAEEIAEIKKKRQELEQEQEQEHGAKYTLSEEDREELLSLITSDELQKIQELFHTGNKMETQTSFNDKEQRTRLHQLLRRAFQGNLETVTSPENTFKIAIAKKKGSFSRGKRSGNDQDSMHHIDANGVVNYGLGKFKPYLHFTVYKQNRDTMDIAHNMSKLLRIPNKAINFAGTKDRRGVTCQKFSIHKGKVLRVSSLNKMTNSGFKLGSFSYQDAPLKLGDLLGNEFTITLRDVKLADESGGANLCDIVAESFASLQTKGFINYFGLQRFGTFSVPTHEFGIALLQEDWGKFVELILSEQDVVAPATTECRRIWKETKDPQRALDALPKHFVAENHILKALCKEKRNEDGSFNRHSYLTSIMAIPKNLRMMYVHAYQSYVWNLVASKRVEMFGLEVQEGDLVLDQTRAAEMGNRVHLDEDGFEEDVAEYGEVPVHAITKEDIESRKYTIFDVVLPTAGFKIQYPTNAKLRQVYIDEMARDKLDAFNLRRKNKEFSLTGTYRNLITKPMHLSYDIVPYYDDYSPIVLTDLEVLEKKKQAEPEEDKEEKEPTKEAEIARIIPQTQTKEADSDCKEKLAVVLKMQLGVSSYATMALREFMKIDTSRNNNNNAN